MSTGEEILRVEELSKNFGEHQVLRKIDFTVKKGEVICILGSSGSGKSTLLRCINRLETPTFGRVYFNGREVGKSQREINEYRSKVGMVFQSFNLFNNMTVLKNCMEGTRKVLRLPKRRGKVPRDHSFKIRRNGAFYQRLSRAIIRRSETESRDRARSVYES